MNDEEWTWFADPENEGNKGWIEVGDTTGQPYHHHESEFQSSPFYFEASYSSSYPVKHGTFAQNYNEVDYLSGGPGNGWWDATTYTENSGSWCATAEEAHLFCFPGLAQYGDGLTDGLEFAANNDGYSEKDAGSYAENEGQVIGYYVNSADQVSQWTGAHLQYIDHEETKGVPSDPWPPAGAWGVCGKLNAKGQGNGAITFEAPAWLDWSECESGPIHWAEESGEPAAGAFAPGLTSALAEPPPAENEPPAHPPEANQAPREIIADYGAPAPTAPAPMEGYSAPPPSSTTLTTEEVLSRGTAVAGEAGEPSPTDIRVVTNVPLGVAMVTAMPGATAPQSPSDGMRAWLESDADMVAMNGQFKLDSAAAPSGAQDPSGRVLTLVLDAHTGQVEDLHLGSSEPEVGKLGQVSTLK